MFLFSLLLRRALNEGSWVLTERLRAHMYRKVRMEGHVGLITNSWLIQYMVSQKDSWYQDDLRGLLNHIFEYFQLTALIKNWPLSNNRSGWCWKQQIAGGQGFSLHASQIFAPVTGMVVSGRRGGRSAASMLLFRSPDGGTLSMLASPQLPLNNQRTTYQGNFFSFFSFQTIVAMLTRSYVHYLRIKVSECFPKSVSAPKRKPRIAERWELKKKLSILALLKISAIMITLKISAILITLKILANLITLHYRLRVIESVH